MKSKKQKKDFISKADLELMIQKIESATLLTRAEISKRVDYSEKYISELLSESSVVSERFVKALKREFAAELENPDSKYSKDPEVPFEERVMISLLRISGQIKKVHAEVRAGTEYHVMKDAGNNEVTRQELMEKINILVSKNESELRG